MGYLVDTFNEIANKLEWQADPTNAGAILTDTYFYRNPLSRNDGRASFPSISMFPPVITEEAGSTRGVMTFLTLDFRLAVANDQRNECAIEDILSLYERFKDALVLKNDGSSKIDTCIGKAVMSHAKISVDESEATETSIVMAVSVTIPIPSGFGINRL